MNAETQAPAPKKARAPRAPKAPVGAKPRARKAKAETGTKKPAPRRVKVDKQAVAGAQVKTTDALKEAAKRYVRDTEHKTAGGNPSVNNGDEVATKLIGKDLDQVYAMAAKTLKVDESELRGQYQHLNVGMQRMNLGNRMRKALK